MLLPMETVLPFFLASLLLALVPGPDNIFVLTQSALRGSGSGLAVTLGLCTGLIVHTVAVALGVAALVQASALAFTVIKLLGACYLLYLAYHCFRAAAASIQSHSHTTLGLARLYRRGIIMNVTNPKVSIFFLAFLPQFADPARGPMTLQLVLLGGVFIVATILVFGSFALLAGTISRWFNRSARGQQLMNRMAGGGFFGLALQLSPAHQ